MRLHTFDTKEEISVQAVQRDEGKGRILLRIGHAGDNNSRVIALSANDARMLAGTLIQHITVIDPVSN
jgi:hypothetical protein